MLPAIAFTSRGNMLRQILLFVTTTVAMSVHALDGEILVHDPSTVILNSGRYYTYGTGNGLPILASDDG